MPRLVFGGAPQALGGIFVVAARGDICASV
jgi:hypothetical protein